MRFRISFLVAFACCGCVSMRAQAPVTVVPTTTLAAETGNNTSTAASFATQSNGNLGAGNVSKLPTRALLVSGSTTPIFAHFMPWFGTASHMNVGYNSADPAQVAKQVNDMLSRGIQGAIVDWYGPNDSQTNNATLALMAEAQKRSGQFQFAVMEDGGALSGCAANPACDITTQLIGDLTYAYNTYQSSPAYFRIQGRPVVPFFAVERFGFGSAARLNIDWARVTASVPGNPMFIFQNAGAYSHTASGGAFSWVMIGSDPADWGQSYLQGFYAAGLQSPAQATFGATYKGFDDRLAAWAGGRVVNQTCGQTWLNTFSQINSQYPAANLPYLQLVTWNDYEEGTEIESGIENCVTVTASLTAAALKWQLTTGSPQAVDHFRVFISNDGTNLMPLADLPATISSVTLSDYALSPGAYTFYVEAIGKASFRNKMSNAVTFVTGDAPPAANLTVSATSGPAPLTVSASLGNSFDADGVIATMSIDFGDGTVVSGNSATHTYNTPGTYRVLGIVRDSQGSTSAAASAVTATNQAPVAKIAASVASGSAPLSVNFSTAGSYDPDGTITSMKIDLGDGTVVNGTAASHAYYWSGTYTITATATDNLGAVTRATTTITVQGPQVTLVSPAYGATVTSPAHVVAGATSANPIAKMTVLVDGVAVSTFSGGSVDTAVALKPGFVHRIDVQATDSIGTSAGTGVRVYDQNLAPQAVLIATPSSATSLSVTASTLASTDVDGTIASSSINFGDGATAAGPTATHTYTAAGTYVVTATVTDNLGAQSTTTQSVTVNNVATATPGVTVMSPTGSTSTNMHVVASAASAFPITAMRVYVDGNSVYVAASSAVDTYVPVSPGSHNLTVQAWDASGAILKNAQTVVAAAGVVPQTGWWWDPQLSGMGFFIEYGGQSGQGLFVGGYLYDAAGNNTWLVSTAPLIGSSYNSTWLKANGGQTLLGAYRANTVQTAAGLSIAFSDATHAVMTRPDGTQINLVRFSFTSSATPAPPVAGTPQSGWWWAGSSYPGTGYGIEIQGSSVFVVAYVYDDAGNPVWYLAIGNLTSPTSYSGSWDVYGGGPQLTSPEGSYSATKRASATAMSLAFSDATHGTLTMGSIAIPITRMQEF